MPFKALYRMFLAVFCFLLAGCVEPIDVKVKDDSNLLIVDGLVTNTPGPYTVKLTRSAAYTRKLNGVNTPVRGAKVIITDISTRERETLQETKSGVYTTNSSGIRGIVGHTYTVDIETPDGEKYRSRPELLQGMPAIDTIYSEFVDGSAGKEEGFYVYLNINDPSNATNYYRWKYTNYRFLKFCNLPEEPQRQCCTVCFNIYPCRNCIILASDVVSNGKQLSKLLTIVPYSQSIIYYLDVEQYSLSKAAHEFWKQMDAQNKSRGGSFDATPAPVQGNIYNINNEEAEVLGFFGASAYELKGVGVKRDYLRPKLPTNEYKDPPFNGNFESRCKPCQEDETQTQIKPRDYKNEWTW